MTKSTYGSDYFGNLTPRMQELRDELLDKTPEICVERAEIVTESYKKNQNKPLHRRLRPNCRQPGFFKQGSSNFPRICNEMGNR